jgi:hypothetical protein
MAIGVNSIVAVKVSSVALTLGNASAQPPAFGSCESAGSPFTITWSNSGARVAAIPTGQLDEITDPSSPTQDLLGQVVNLKVGASPAMSGVVIGAYARTGVDCVLVKLLQANAYVELLAANVSLQAGQ